MCLFACCLCVCILSFCLYLGISYFVLSLSCVFCLLSFAFCLLSSSMFFSLSLAFVFAFLVSSCFRLSLFVLVLAVVDCVSTMLNFVICLSVSLSPYSSRTLYSDETQNVSKECVQTFEPNAVDSRSNISVDFFRMSKDLKLTESGPLSVVLSCLVLSCILVFLCSCVLVV